MPRKNNQARRVKKKLAKVAAKMIEDGGRYGEFCERDDMPGRVWKFKADQTATECDCCDRKFCQDCDCQGSVSNLPCLCPAQTCMECMQRHIDTNEKPCGDPDCTRIHFECPTCRKEMNFVALYGFQLKSRKMIEAIALCLSCFVLTISCLASVVSFIHALFKYG